MQYKKTPKTARKSHYKKKKKKNQVWSRLCEHMRFFFSTVLMSVLESLPVDADYKVCSGRGRCSGKDLPTDLLHNQQVSFWICANGMTKITRTAFSPKLKQLLWWIQIEHVYEKLLDCCFPFLNRFLTIMRWRWWSGGSPTHSGCLTQQVFWISDMVPVCFMFVSL